MFRRGHSGDGCVLAWTLCKYTMSKCDLFVLSWARERRGSISSELLMCGGGVRSILPRNNRCMYIPHVCFYVCCSGCVGLWECLLCSGHC